MTKKIKVAIAGVGNCASSLIQGLEYYKDVKSSDETIPGLMHPFLGGYLISDIEVVAAFDVDCRKVGKDISEAIFEPPNCTKIFSNVEYKNVEVMKGMVLDGIAAHMTDYFKVDETQKYVNVSHILEDTHADLLINYLPVGSEEATKWYAFNAIKAKCGFINCIPVFIGSSDQWNDLFRKEGLPIIGDDIKSQVGATIMHRAILNMMTDRGAKIDSTYQTNFGGNTDFRNMTDQSRLISKRISKTESISAQIPYDASVYAGPNGCIDSLKDNKIAHMRIDFRIFGDVKCYTDLKLSVEDSPNSAGTVIDCIRLAKIALDRNIGGSLLSASAWLMKHPPTQYDDNSARQMTEDFIAGRRDN
jgi:myo-inositol-1-phosphate synthase